MYFQRPRIAQRLVTNIAGKGLLHPFLDMKSEVAAIDETLVAEFTHKVTMLGIYMCSQPFACAKLFTTIFTNILGNSLIINFLLMSFQIHFVFEVSVT